MKIIVIQSDVKGADEFRRILSDHLPDFHIALSIEEVNLVDVEVVIIWLSVPNFLFRLPNLKLILSCGSGVDHIINSPNLPHNIPLIRLVDPFLQNNVTQYVVKQISNFRFPEINIENQEEVLRELLKSGKRKKPKIGIMGLGLVGSSIAEKLQKIGFDVCGWVKSAKPRSIKEVYIGNRELPDFLIKCEVIICQLPLTKETKGILNKHLFNLLQNGTYLINVGRGEHLVESDLLWALEKGKISGACLDVLKLESLPLNHPFHDNPKIKITPHIAGYIGPETQATYASEIIICHYNNEIPLGLVDYNESY